MPGARETLEGAELGAYTTSIQTADASAATEAVAVVAIASGRVEPPCRRTPAISARSTNGNTR